MTKLHSLINSLGNLYISLPTKTNFYFCPDLILVILFNPTTTMQTNEFGVFHAAPLRTSQQESAGKVFENKHMTIVPRLAQRYMKTVQLFLRLIHR